MDAMQGELDTAYPALKIQLMGVNQRGQEPGNVSATDGIDLPWLQDVDFDANGAGDVADDLWDVTFRDVVILDGNNVQVGVYNLTEHNLDDADHYAALRELLVDAAMQSQRPWRNAVNPLDVDASGTVVPLDILRIVNQLDAAGSYRLPPPTGAELTQPFYDCNGDGNLTPADPLQIINFLNNDSNQAEGESSPVGIKQTMEAVAPTMESASNADGDHPTSGGVAISVTTRGENLRAAAKRESRDQEAELTLYRGDSDADKIDRVFRRDDLWDLAFA